MSDYVRSLFRMGYGFSRQEADQSPKVQRDDRFIPDIRPIDGGEGPFGEVIMPRLARSLTQYAAEFDILTHQSLAGWHVKAQRTQRGQGYHDFHFEASDLLLSRRVLAWTLYLNDDFEGGELEFLYYAKRLKPAAGTLVIFPAAFTHTHRGNMVLQGEKLILTGWFEFFEHRTAGSPMHAS